MTLRGFTYRFAYVILFTWIVGSIIDSFWMGLYLAVVPIAFYEVVRPRRPRDDHESDHHQNT